MSTETGCAHCKGADEDRLWADETCRVVLVHETGFEGWCRVIWHDHIRELSDLTPKQRDHVMAVVSAVETGLIAKLAPVKINIASLGTAAPHLHFHVIPRFVDDPAFPDPVWLPAKRTSSRKLPDGFAQSMAIHLQQQLK
jgi:diadenosine tetraphosphate (Ap4A) HIT family hydrolase